ncbi:iron-siderophore ABC transporter substrate-binding protein [Salana multivorans]
MQRRRASVALIAAASALTLAACSSSSPSTTTTPETEESSAETQAEETSSEAPADESAFPATIDTKFGAVTVEEQPERVVALGWGDAEVALALGVQPVGASDWVAFGGEGVGPWAEGLYDEAPEIIGTMEPSYEAIAALEPDLILDVRSSGDQERYDRLSSIATTVGVPEGGDSWLATRDQQVDMIAAALGQSEAGQALIDEVDEAFAEVSAAHPDWAGKTVTVATRTSEGWGAYATTDGRVQLLEGLGFTQSPTIESLPLDENGWSVTISAEQLDLLDADLLVAFPIFINASEITDDARLAAHPHRGRRPLDRGGRRALAGVLARHPRRAALRDRPLHHAHRGGARLSDPPLVGDPGTRRASRGLSHRA